MSKFNIKDIIKTKSNYAEAMYTLYKKMRFGIDACCKYDLDKWDVKNSLVDLDSIYDPNLCVDLTPTPDACCPQPCNAIANLFLPIWTTCPEPINASASITL